MDLPPKMANFPMNDFRSSNGPSPPPSIARSSNGTGIYATSDSGRNGLRDDNTEATLGEHYLALRSFLYTGEGISGQAPNKAKDKLLRLSPVQFLELSTDVYDELMRRQTFSSPGPGAMPTNPPPPYLMPEANFHPKRNQARQKLSSLGPARFRDLATDVFCELERRFPRFIAGDIPSLNSPVNFNSPRPISGRSQAMRRPSDASSVRNPPPPFDAYNMPPSPNVGPGDFNRPQPKHSQSNTIVPNKSTMVEEDDDDGQPSDLAADGVSPTSRNNADNAINAIDHSEALQEMEKKVRSEYAVQLDEMKEKMNELQKLVEAKLEELDQERNEVEILKRKQEEWETERSSLESQLKQAKDSAHDEVEKLQQEHDGTVRQLREELEEAAVRAMQKEEEQARQLDELQAGPIPGSQDPSLLRENEELRAELEQQRTVTVEVQQQSRELLEEIRELSMQSNASWQKQDALDETVDRLEKEVELWRDRYTKAKTQLRSLQADSFDMTAEKTDVAQVARDKGLLVETGLVKDIHLTRFQVSVNELLQRARKPNDGEKITEEMKVTVNHIRHILKDIESLSKGSEADRKLMKQHKASLATTTNSLITAVRSYVASAGMTSVMIVDTALINLVAAVAQLIQAVKVSPSAELELEDDGTVSPIGSGYLSPVSPPNESFQQQNLRLTASLNSIANGDYPKPPPPPFRGLGDSRYSGDSSSFSHRNSSHPDHSDGRVASNRSTGADDRGFLPSLQDSSSSTDRPDSKDGPGRDDEVQLERFQEYLEEQIEGLALSIQALVTTINENDVSVEQIQAKSRNVDILVHEIQREASANGHGSMTSKLMLALQQLRDVTEHGDRIAREVGPAEARAVNISWQEWTHSLPPVALDIVKEARELVKTVDQLLMSQEEFA